MGKLLVSFSGIVLLTMGLTACGNFHALGPKHYHLTQPINYTNDNQPVRRGMDHTGPVSNLLRNVNQQNFNYVSRYHDQGFVSVPSANENGTYRRIYTNHDNNLALIDYQKPENSTLAKKITDRINKINEIDDSQVAVTDNAVFVAIKSHMFTKEDRTYVKNVVEQIADGRTVHIMTGHQAFTRVRELKAQYVNGQYPNSLVKHHKNLMNQ